LVSKLISLGNEMNKPVRTNGVPQSRLNLRLSRREFLLSAFQEYQVAKGRQETNGIAFRLSELGSWPDEQLGQLRPRWKPEIEIVQDGTYICFRFPSGGQPTRMFDCRSLEAEVFNLFNGDFTIDWITQWLCSKMTWEREQAFVFVRGLFFQLVELRVCVPK
jgi:hypothetical protein